MKFKILLCFIFIYNLTVFSQNNSLTGFTFSVNTGLYFANYKDAYFYDGSDLWPSTLEDVLGNTTVYDEITTLLGDNIAGYSTPFKMRYEPSFLVGLQLMYLPSNSFGYYIKTDVIKLETSGVVSLELASPPQSSGSYSNTVNGVITASEKRFNIASGFHINLNEVYNKKIEPFIEFGFLASILQTDEHIFTIQSYSTSMGYNSQNLGTYLYKSFTFGGQFCIGGNFEVKNKVLSLGLGLDATNYKLGYSKYLFQKSIQVKFYI